MASEDVQIRILDTIDIGAVTAILTKRSPASYRPDEWERRIAYYLRRDPEAALVAELDGEVVGFMLGEVRSGEFGLEEPTGWIEVLGVDPERRGGAIGRRLAEALLDHFRGEGRHFGAHPGRRDDGRRRRLLRLAWDSSRRR